MASRCSTNCQDDRQWRLFSIKVRFSPLIICYYKRRAHAKNFWGNRLTGAGEAVTTALSSVKPLPKQMESAVLDVCDEAISRHVNVFLDAEQHHVQPGIDKVALNLMRRYNRKGVAVVFNTYQGYLKSAPRILLDHLHIAREERFVLGIKLVRGAYMSTEPRHLIHDTKEETDISYDSIAEGPIQGQYASWTQDEVFSSPKLELFLATHNLPSTLKAQKLQTSRMHAQLPIIRIQYGQLLGMADEVSLTLLQLNQEDASDKRLAATEVYKCLTWGTLNDCIFYLLRRANENKDAVTRTLAEYKALKREIVRRMTSIFS